MATVPVLDSIESRVIGQDAATLQFQRLERVRARLGARRRHRLIFATKLVIVASVGVLGFTLIHLTSFARLGSHRAPAPVATLMSAAASPAADSIPAATVSTLPAATDSIPAATVSTLPAARDSALPAVTDSALPAATDSAFAPPVAIMPPPAPVERVKRDVTDPPRIRANANRRGRPLSRSEGRGAAAPSRGEQEDVGPVDSTAAIDWLLKTSPTSAMSASHALLPNREEIPR